MSEETKTPEVNLDAIEPNVSDEVKILVLKSEKEQMEIGYYRLVTAARVCATVQDKQQLEQLKKQVQMAQEKMVEYDKLIAEAQKRIDEKKK